MSASDVSTFHLRFAHLTQLSGTCRGLWFGFLCGWFVFWACLFSPCLFRFGKCQRCFDFFFNDTALDDRQCFHARSASRLKKNLLSDGPYTSSGCCPVRMRGSQSTGLPNSEPPKPVHSTARVLRSSTKGRHLSSQCETHTSTLKAAFRHTCCSDNTAWTSRPSRVKPLRHFETPSATEPTGQTSVQQTHYKVRRLHLVIVDLWRPWKTHKTQYDP